MGSGAPAERPEAGTDEDLSQAPAARRLERQLPRKGRGRGHPHGEPSEVHGHVRIQQQRQRLGGQEHVAPGRDDLVRGEGPAGVAALDPPLRDAHQRMDRPAPAIDELRPDLPRLLLIRHRRLLEQRPERHEHTAVRREERRYRQRWQVRQHHLEDALVMIRRRLLGGRDSGQQPRQQEREGPRRPPVRGPRRFRSEHAQRGRPHRPISESAAEGADPHQHGGGARVAHRTESGTLPRISGHGSNSVVRSIRRGSSR